MPVYNEGELTEVKATAAIDRMIRQSNRRVKAIRQKQAMRHSRREYYQPEQEPEIDMSTKQEGESYMEWWERIGRKQHNDKPWQFI